MHRLGAFSGVEIMNVTKAALQAENAQLRALLAAEVELRTKWEKDARRAKYDIVELRASAWHVVKATAPAGATRADYARKFCEINKVRSVSAEDLDAYIKYA